MKSEHEDILALLQSMEKEGRLDRIQLADIPIEVYHHPLCPGVSSSAIKTVLRRSWSHHLAGGLGERDAFRFGNAFHCFNNEPHLFRETYYICAFDRKFGEQWAAAQSHAAGRIILMQKDFLQIQVMSKKLWEHPMASDLMRGSRAEVTFFSRDEATGVLKKCRVDNIKGKLLSDLKSTQDASQEEFTWQCRRLLYRISAAYYLEIVSEVYQELFSDFYLIPCEKEDPYEVDVIRVPDESIARAQGEIRSALEKIKVIQRNPNAWIGYALEPKEYSI